MKKRLISLALIICLCFVTSVSAFAAENTNTITEKQIQTEIEVKKAAIMASVHRQLEAQGKTHMITDYEEILFPEIEASVYAKYGILEEYMPQATNAMRFYFPYGGVIANETSGGRYALSTFMIPADTDEFFEDYFTFTSQDIIEFALGFVPIFGPIASAMLFIRFAVDSKTRQEIKENGNYARTLVLRGDDNSFVILVWDTYPYGETYAYATGTEVEYEAFPAH